MDFFKTKYRIARDSYHSQRWAVQQRLWYWPFWTEVGNGLLKTKQEAAELIDCLRTHYAKRGD